VFVVVPAVVAVAPVDAPVAAGACAGSVSAILCRAATGDRDRMGSINTLLIR
jgi:hypothetical protein